MLDWLDAFLGVFSRGGYFRDIARKFACFLLFQPGFSLSGLQQQAFVLVHSFPKVSSKHSKCKR